MPTPRFRNLKPETAANIAAAFLGFHSTVDFTEKISGQHLTATSDDGSSWNFYLKGKSTATAGAFLEVEQALKDHHPKTSKTTTYQFEIVKKTKRPDYIDYPLKKSVAVEYSGAMTRDVADVLNSSQEDIQFLVKEDIKKSISDVSLSEHDRQVLQGFVDVVSSGKRPTASQYSESEEVLMKLLDSGQFPSSLGGKRIEGLFGVSSDDGFKIPSQYYADLQRIQARLYAVSKKMKSNDLKKRFKDAAGRPDDDKIVKDVIEYIDFLENNPPPEGFRVFFSRNELSALKQIVERFVSGDEVAGQQLASLVFRRINDKASWVSTGVNEMSNRINVDNSVYVKEDRITSIISEGRLREFIRLIFLECL